MIAQHLPSPAQVARVRDLLQQVPQDAARRRVGPLCVFGMWRGQDAWLVGYEWTRVAGTPRHDQVREEVLGHGLMLEDAIAMMTQRICGACSLPQSL